MYTYIITYRFKTINGKQRPIYNAFIDWVEANGKCDDTTSTAYYCSNDNYETIKDEIESLYTEYCPIHKDDHISIIEVDEESDEVTKILSLVDKEWKEADTILEMITEEDI